MKIAIGCDHRGIDMKNKVIKILTDAGHTSKDFGAYTTDSVDYPDIAEKVGKAVVDGEYDRGILICGTGIGMCIAANKVKGIRAAQCYDEFCATRARQHNNANIMCLGAEIPPKNLKEVVNLFLTTEFEGGRHQRRIEKITNIEK
jgi:ribose 5-phosphate isomerase B